MIEPGPHQLAVDEKFKEVSGAIIGDSMLTAR